MSRFILEDRSYPEPKQPTPELPRRQRAQTLWPSIDVTDEDDGIEHGTASYGKDYERVVESRVNNVHEVSDAGDVRDNEDKEDDEIDEDEDEDDGLEGALRPPVVRVFRATSVKMPLRVPGRKARGYMTVPVVEDEVHDPLAVREAAALDAAVHAASPTFAEPTKPPPDLEEEKTNKALLKRIREEFASLRPRSRSRSRDGSKARGPRHAEVTRPPPAPTRPLHIQQKNPVSVRHAKKAKPEKPILLETTTTPDDIAEIEPVMEKDDQPAMAAAAAAAARGGGGLDERAYDLGVGAGVGAVTGMVGLWAVGKVSRWL